MRILMMHNFYQSPGGGEDQSFRQEVALLRTHGHDVVEYTVSNDDVKPLGPARTAWHLLRHAAWSAPQAERVGRLVRDVRPDIAHVQNFWFMLTPSVHHACRTAGVPVVQHLRNYRLGCLNGNCLRRGAACELCIGRRPWRGILYRCYRLSVVSSWTVYRMVMLNRRRGTWRDDVDAFICLTRQSRERMIRIGLAPEKIHLRANFVHEPPPAGSRANDAALFVGRISPEKGFDVLTAAWRSLPHPRPPLRVCGSSLEEFGQAQREAFRRDGIEMLGHMPRERVMRELQNCRFVVMPTVCFENMPRVIVEAFAAGTPVIGSRIGAVAEMIEDGRTGYLFEAGNARDLADRIARALAQPDEVARMGRQARLEFEAKYSPDRAHESLLTIYTGVLASRARQV